MMSYNNSEYLKKYTKSSIRIRRNKALGGLQDESDCS